MANMRDVAQEAGTSVATVSRILSNDVTFETTKQTRRNVIDAAKKLNYNLKPVKRAQKKVQIGCILALTAEKYSDPFFTSILSAAEEECVAHNAIISTVRNYNELENPAILTEMCSLGLSGLIVMENLPEDMLKLLKGSIPHIVTVDQPNYEFNSVGFDNIESNLQVMNCLIDRGYRRIAYIGGSPTNLSFMDSPRMLIYRDVLCRNNIPYDPSIVINCNWDLGHCASCTTELFSSDTPPDAIFAGSDSLASIVLGAIYKLGLKCPQDVGVIGFNNIGMSAHTAPPLTTIDIPTKEIGTVAVQRLMDIIKGRDDHIMRITFPTKLILRDSLRDIKEIKDV